MCQDNSTTLPDEMIYYIVGKLALHTFTSRCAIYAGVVYAECVRFQTCQPFLVVIKYVKVPVCDQLFCLLIAKLVNWQGVMMPNPLCSTSHSSSSSSLGSRCVLWLGEGLSMPSPNYPVLCYPLPYRVAPVFVQVVSPPLGWSPLTSFLVIWSPSGDARGPSVVFEAVNMPCPGPFHFSTSY